MSISRLKSEKQFILLKRDLNLILDWFTAIDFYLLQVQLFILQKPMSLCAWMAFNYRLVLPFCWRVQLCVCAWVYVCLNRNCIWQNWVHVRACIFNQVFIQLRAVGVVRDHKLCSRTTGLVIVKVHHIYICAYICAFVVLAFKTLNPFRTRINHRGAAAYATLFLLQAP